MKDPEQRLNEAALLLNDITKQGGCDLHLHTNASDGSDSVDSLVNKVIENRLQCFAITDHDSVESVKKAIKVLDHIEGEGIKIPKLIPGIEISVTDEREIHILGYFPFGGYEKMKKFILLQQKRRYKRNIKLCDILTRTGMQVSIEELTAKGSGVVGRLHAANILVDKGYVKSVDEAFSKWLGYGKPCYIRRVESTAKQAIKAIQEAGGVSVIAHPFLYGWTNGNGIVSDKLYKKLKQLKSYGLLGVEAFHGEGTLMQNLETYSAAKALDLIVTAGSDYHGKNKMQLSMYDFEKSFYKEFESIEESAIIKVGEQYLLTSNMLEKNTGKWQFISTKFNINSSNNLLEEIQKQVGIYPTSKPLHKIVSSEDSIVRKVVLTYNFNQTRHKKEIQEHVTRSKYLKLFKLGELSNTNIRKPDSKIIDMLREIKIKEI